MPLRTDSYSTVTTGGYTVNVNPHEARIRNLISCKSPQQQEQCTRAGVVLEQPRSDNRTYWVYIEVGAQGFEPVIFYLRPPSATVKQVEPLCPDFNIARRLMISLCYKNDKVMVESMYQRKQASPYQKFGFLGMDRLGCPDGLKRFKFDSYRVSLSVAQASTSRFDA